MPAGSAPREIGVGIVEFLIIATILGVAAWALTTYVPMPQGVKTVIVIAVVLFLVLILLRAMVGDISIPRLRG